MTGTTDNAISSSEEWKQETCRRKGFIEKMHTYNGKILSVLEKHDCISEIGILRLYQIQVKHLKLYTL